MGNPQTSIHGVSEIQSGKPDTITFLANPKYKQFLLETSATAVVVKDSNLLQGKAGIVVENPQLAIALILGKYARPVERTEGIHPTAIVHETATIGNSASVGPYTVIGKNVTIAQDAIIGARCSIGEESSLADNVVLLDNVILYPRAILGKNVTIHSGTVIGSDGYGFVQSGDTHIKIPQSGRVVLENDVEIGSNCTIDRGTIGDTAIGAGTKIDNLVHVAHNVKIGKGCLLTGQVGIAGSSIIGDFCIFAGQTGVAPHLTIGDRAIFAAKSGVTKSLPGGKVYAGMPAREIHEQNRRDAVLSKMNHLKKRLEKIEAHLNLAGSNDT